MDRTKLAFAALFPALWLLLCGPGLSAQHIDCSKKSSGAQACTLQSGKHCSSDAVSSRDITARRAASRLGKSGNGNALPLHLVSGLNVPERASAAVTPERESPVALATYWQFALRAALAPRAPSSVS